MKSAWKDVEDEIPDEEGLKVRKVKLTAKRGAKYESRLVDQFELVHGSTPSWAKLKRKKENLEDGEDVTDAKKSDTDFSSGSLKRGNVKLFRVLDLNSASRESGAIIRSIKFHPKSQVGFVAGGSSVALYQVDGVNNTKIQSVEFENFPLRNACFTAGGEEILVSSGLMGHFYSYDMISGDISKVKPNKLTEKETIRNLIPSPDDKLLVGLGHHGNMYLFSSRSKEVIDTLTMNGEVTGVTFNSDGSRMYSCGVEGEIYTWDINRRVCVDKYGDHGTVSSTSVATSQNFLATGSNAGVVNVYRHSNAPPGTPRQPEKAIMNLVTPISSVEFNRQEEILVMASSLTVFANFPAFDADWGRPNSVAFSPNSGYFSIGNNKGSAYLFRLSHYENY